MYKNTQDLSILGTSLIYVLCYKAKASPINRFAAYVSVRILMIISTIKIINEGKHKSVYKCVASIKL